MEGSSIFTPLREESYQWREELLAETGGEVPRWLATVDGFSASLHSSQEDGERFSVGDASAEFPLGVHVSAALYLSVRDHGGGDDDPAVPAASLDFAASAAHQLFTLSAEPAFEQALALSLGRELRPSTLAEGPNRYPEAAAQAHDAYQRASPPGSRVSSQRFVRWATLPVTLAHLAHAMAVLANYGRLPQSGRAVWAADSVSALLTHLLRSTLWVALPTLSCSLSGTVAVAIPGQLGLAARSPPLDERGVPVRGRRLIASIAARYPHVRLYGAAHLPRALHEMRRDSRVAGLLLLEAAAAGEARRVDELLQAELADVHAVNCDQRTALHVAVANDHEDVVRLLVRFGADYAREDRWGNTALAEARARAKKSPQARAIAAFLDSAQAMRTRLAPTSLLALSRSFLSLTLRSQDDFSLALTPPNPCQHRAKVVVLGQPKSGKSLFVQLFLDRSDSFSGMASTTGGGGMSDYSPLPSPRNAGGGGLMGSEPNSPPPPMRPRGRSAIGSSLPSPMSIPLSTNAHGSTPAPHHSSTSPNPVRFFVGDPYSRVVEDVLVGGHATSLGKPFRVSVWDDVTGGRVPGHDSPFVDPGSTVLVYTYDASVRQSSASLATELTALQRIHPDVPLLLVGTHADLLPPERLLAAEAFSDHLRARLGPDRVRAIVLSSLPSSSSSVAKLLKPFRELLGLLSFPEPRLSPAARALEARLAELQTAGGLWLDHREQLRLAHACGLTGASATRAVLRQLHACGAVLFLALRAPHDDLLSLQPRALHNLLSSIPDEFSSASPAGILSRELVAVALTRASGEPPVEPAMAALEALGVLFTHPDVPLSVFVPSSLPSRPDAALADALPPSSWRRLRLELTGDVDGALAGAGLDASRWGARAPARLVRWRDGLRADWDDAAVRAERRADDVSRKGMAVELAYSLPAGVQRAHALLEALRAGGKVVLERVACPGCRAGARHFGAASDAADRCALPIADALRAADAGVVVFPCGDRLSPDSVLWMYRLPWLMQMRVHPDDLIFTSVLAHGPSSLVQSAKLRVPNPNSSNASTNSTNSANHSTSTNSSLKIPQTDSSSLGKGGGSQKVRKVVWKEIVFPEPIGDAGIPGERNEFHSSSLPIPIPSGNLEGVVEKKLKGKESGSSTGSVGGSGAGTGGAVVVEGGTEAAGKGNHLSSSSDRSNSQATAPLPSWMEPMCAAFSREVAAQRAMDHPNCVRLVGYWLGPSQRMALVMEHVRGENLYDCLHVHKRELPWPLRFRVALDIALAGAAMHALSPPLLHRDLKSPNVLLTAALDGLDAHGARACAKVADFGSVHRSSGWAHGRLVDNPIWLAPEVMANMPYSRPSDVYSFGVILYELFTGQTYFGDCSFMSLVEDRVLEGSRPPLLRDYQVPKPAADLLHRCWAASPSARPRFAEAASLLAEWLAAEAPLHPTLADRVNACTFRANNSPRIVLATEISTSTSTSTSASASVPSTTISTTTTTTTTTLTAPTASTTTLGTTSFSKRALRQSSGRSLSPNDSSSSSSLDTFSPRAAEFEDTLHHRVPSVSEPLFHSSRNGNEGGIGTMDSNSTPSSMNQDEIIRPQHRHGALQSKSLGLSKHNHSSQSPRFSTTTEDDMEAFTDSSANYPLETSTSTSMSTATGPTSSHSHSAKPSRRRLLSEGDSSTRTLGLLGTKFRSLQAESLLPEVAALGQFRLPQVASAAATHKSWIWVGLSDGRILVINRAASKLLAEPFAAHREPVASMVASPSRGLLFSADRLSVSVWDLDTPGKRLAENKKNAGGVGLALSPWGDRVWVADGGGLRELRFVKSKLKPDRSVSWGEAVVAVHDTTRNASPVLVALCAHAVVLVDPASATVMERYAFSASEMRLTAVLPRLDESRLWLGSQDGWLRVWDVARGTFVLQCLAHPGASVSALSASPTGACLASASLDGSLIFWDLHHLRRTMKCSLAHGGGVFVLLHVLDSKSKRSLLISAGGDGFVRSFDLDR